jgi:hypothetical protein
VASGLLRAIEAGFGTVNPGTGEVVSKAPADSGAVLSAGDAVSAAAFFLGDACMGLRAAASAPSSLGLGARAAAQVETAKRAIGWLRDPTQVALLTKGDADAPNRLLFDARAYLACGVLTGDPAATATAGTFLTLAEATQRSDGVFVKKGGSDTNYQSVSVRNALDIAALADDPTCAELFPRALAGARWLAGRVRADGTVDSSGNTRTCGGGETLLGKPKKLGLVVLFEALAEAGALAADDNVFAAATRAAQHYQANPSADTCK